MVGPTIAVGSGNTIITVVTKQPPGNVYVIVVVPAVLAIIMPVAVPMDATEVLLLLHEPPVVASVTVIELPAQTVAGPPIITGAG